MDLAELFDQHGPIEALELDDELIEHLRERSSYRKHAVSLSEIIQVLEVAPLFFENTGPDRSAPVIMVGPTDSRRMLVIPVEPTRRRGVWRPVTAFEANTHHKRRYQAEGGQT